ncbi:hypothetical protein BDQ12DRAFT_673727 [Crucibulum laeve]|uniref:Uncharacterized protein n=1 Tax=Crucibulum laeve TaxID=68775 RepID=A0A5C3MI72_9AGAR|nr:hypothetical protein BDQ12DRAFT_673727 [Crucibulum laeve]
MAELKARLTGEIKRQVFLTAINHVKQQVPIEIRRQTEQQVEVQIRGYIPIPLRQQAVENKRQLAEMKASLANSKSRIRNESLDMASQDEPLTPIYLLDGTKSKYFPADLRSLLAYDPQSMKNVLNDYGLMEDEDHEINLRRFLSYIG